MALRSLRSARAVAVAPHAFAITFTVALFVMASVTPAAASCSTAQGQLLIDQGLYKRAIREFTCLIDAQPTGIEGYRGRAEAELLLGEYANAALDYAQLNRVVVPVHPDAAAIIDASYAARLAAAPDDIPALTGASFARWWFFDYPGAIRILNHLLDVRPDDVFGNLFRGSSRLLKGTSRAAGAADLENAIALAPTSPDVRFIVADAYTYGYLPDIDRAFAEASFALAGGVDTPRIHAILAAGYRAFGNVQAAAIETKQHIDAVTGELVPTSPIAAGTTLTLDLVPSRTFEIPLALVAGQPISITTGSGTAALWDTIIVLLAPNGTPVVSADDYFKYFAAFEYVPSVTGTYRLRVTSFEATMTGELVVKRD